MKTRYFAYLDPNGNAKISEMYGSSKSQFMRSCKFRGEKYLAGPCNSANEAKQMAQMAQK